MLGARWWTRLLALEADVAGRRDGFAVGSQEVPTKRAESCTLCRDFLARTAAASPKREAPRERCGRGRCAARGDSKWERPSTTGRSLGVSLNSTYIARRARRHGGRCRVIGPVAGCPAPFPSRRNPSHPIRTNPDRLRQPTREDLELERRSVARRLGGSPPSSKTLADKVGLRRTGGSPPQLRHRRLAPRQAGSPVGDDWVVVVPAPIPLTPRRPRPFSVRCPRAPDRLSSDPGWRCALRYVGHLGRCILPGQGLSANSQGCPRNFLVTHSAAPFIHRSCTAIPTESGGPGRRRRPPRTVLR
jgi:hypothetical protein